MKIILILSTIAIFAFSGCVTEKIPEIINTNVFDHEKFTLTLPADFDWEYLKNENTIRPLTANEFPEIHFGVYDDMMIKSPENLLAKAKEGYKNLCSETESCPQIVEEKFIQFGLMPGYYIITENKNLMGDTTDIQFAHRYLFYDGLTVINFIVYEYGETRSEEFEKEVKYIFDTLKFK